MGVISALLFVPVLLLGFTVSSSLATKVSVNQFWLLGLGLACSLIVPAVLASWLRALRRGQAAHGAGERKVRPGEEQPRGEQELPRSPGTIGTVVAMNLVLVVASAAAAPTLTRKSVEQHGSWWMRRAVVLAGKEPTHPAVRHTGATLRWMVKFLPAGDDSAAKPARLSPVVRLDGRVPPPAVPDAAPDAVSSRDGAASDEVKVAFKKQGSAIVVPVTLRGVTGQTTVKMIFDTGATVTTINEATLHALGQAVGPQDPSVESHTANGKVNRTLTVIEGAGLGGAEVLDGLAVALCDPCASGEVVGLLGLNFSRHFAVTVDHEAGLLLLKPKQKPVSRLYDIRHFVELADARGLWRGPLFSVKLVVRNRSARALHNVRVAAQLTRGRKSATIASTVKEVPARGQASMKIQGFPEVKGTKFLLKVESAGW